MKFLGNQVQEIQINSVENIQGYLEVECDNCAMVASCVL